MPNGEPGHLHPERTTRSQFQYFIYDKHHGRGGPDVSQWAADVTENEEFGVFNQADVLELFDGGGNLYGLRITAEGHVLVLGTLQQQVAKFPVTPANQPWHGYPLGPIKPTGKVHPPERPLPRDALQRMVEAGLLTQPQRKRLLKGGRA